MPNLNYLYHCLCLFQKMYCSLCPKSRCFYFFFCFLPSSTASPSSLLLLLSYSFLLLSSSSSLPSSSSSLLFVFVLFSSFPIFHLFFFVLRNLNHCQTFYHLQYQHQSVSLFLLYYFEHSHFC